MCTVYRVPGVLTPFTQGWITMESHNPTGLHFDRRVLPRSRCNGDGDARSKIMLYASHEVKRTFTTQCRYLRQLILVRTKQYRSLLTSPTHERIQHGAVSRSTCPTQGVIGEAQTRARTEEHTCTVCGFYTSPGAEACEQVYDSSQHTTCNTGGGEPSSCAAGALATRTFTPLLHYSARIVLGLSS